MRNIIFIISVYIFFILIAFGTYLFSFQTKIPITHIDILIVGIISLLVAERLRIRQKGEISVRSIRDFQLFFFNFSIFMFFMALPGLFFNDVHRYQQWIVPTFWIGHIFLYISLAYFIRIPLFWINPIWINYGFSFVILLGSITTAVNIWLPISADILPSGTTYWHIDIVLGILIATNVALGLLPAGIYFIYRGFLDTDMVIKTQTLLIGVGLIILFLGGPLHDVVKTPLLFFLTDIMFSLGVVLIALGVFYRENFG